MTNQDHISRIIYDKLGIDKINKICFTIKVVSFALDPNISI